MYLIYFVLQHNVMSLPKVDVRLDFSQGMGLPRARSFPSGSVTIFSQQRNKRTKKKGITRTQFHYHICAYVFKFIF